MCVFETRTFFYNIRLDQTKWLFQDSATAGTSHEFYDYDIDYKKRPDDYEGEDYFVNATNIGLKSAAYVKYNEKKYRIDADY